MLAAVVAVTAGLGVVTAALGGVAVAIVALVEDDFTTAEALAWSLATLVATAAVCAVGTRTTVLATRYARGEPASGRKIAWLFAATWALWLVWGIPASVGWFSAVLLFYTAFLLPCAIAAYVLWKLIAVVRRRVASGR